MAQQAKVCGALDPVPHGMRRFRVRGTVGGKRQALLYILAASQPDAEAAYVAELSLQGQDVTFTVGVTPN